ncbi:MAG: AAA family ATPase [Planctomycetota bacterium]
MKSSVKSGYNILLITREETTVEKIKSALNTSDLLRLADIRKEVSELRNYLSKNKVQAVVVDIDPDPSRVLYDLAGILTSYPEIYIVVVCSHFTKKLAVQAMQAGVRHFVEKKTIASDLNKELQQLIHGSVKKEAVLGSAVISIFSAGGGCGATTVAVNLANELQILSSKPVLAVDMDSCYGTVSTYLGIKSQYGIADVLARKGLIDEHLIQSSAYGYKDNFHVLTSPASIESPRAKSIQLENLPRVLEACRGVYRYTIIDAPRMQEDDIAKIAGLSDVILIVFQLTVKDVNFARSIVLSLTKSGIASEKIMAIANRVKKRGPLVRLEDSSKAMGLKSCHAIRSDWRKAMKSVISSQPLAQVVKKSGLRNDFRKLAAKICTYGVNGSNNISG